MILHVEGPTASTGIPVSGNNVWRSGPLHCFRQNWWMVPIHPFPRFLSKSVLGNMAVCKVVRPLCVPPFLISKMNEQVSQGFRWLVWTRQYKAAICSPSDFQMFQEFYPRKLKRLIWNSPGFSWSSAHFSRTLYNVYPWSEACVCPSHLAELWIRCGTRLMLLMNSVVWVAVPQLLRWN